MFGKNPKRHPETGDGSTLKIVEIFPTLQGEGPFVGQPSVFVRLGGCNLACGFCDTEFETFEEMNLEDVLAQVLKLAGDGDAGAPLPAGEAGLLNEPKASFSNPGEGASTQAHAQPRPHPDLQPIASRSDWANPTSPAGRGGPASPFVRDLVVITGGEPLRQNIAPLCEALLANGFRVQIETNGTLWRPLPDGVNVVCSPKITDGKYHPLRPDLLARVDALKFIVSADEAEYREVGEVGQAGTNIPVYVQPMDEYDPSKNAANLARALNIAQTYGYRLSVQMHKMWGIA